MTTNSTHTETPIVGLNADLGESFGAWKMGMDEALLQIVDSANIACGFHAGDPLVMRRTIQAAKANNVDIGAHPSFPDLQGFGRRNMIMAPDELEAAIIYQIAALDGMAKAEGARVVHVKAHGALNNMAAADYALAQVVARAIHAYDPSLVLLSPALSQLSRAGKEQGLRVAEEAFADRAYEEDGSLVSRSKPGAMIHGAEASLAHVKRMLESGGLISASGKVLSTPIHSICVHGDGPDAVNTARLLRDSLRAEGYTLKGLA